MEVYQRVLEVIFSSLKSRSWNGEPLECWDKLVRVFHPGIHILSLDGKEAAYFNACRAALANYPCPKCLVHHCELHKLTKTFKLRTTATMKAVVLKARRVTTKTAKEELLKNHGLHGIKVQLDDFRFSGLKMQQHFLWGFRFSDPYAAYSYDTLHSDDLGKWGDHLWDLLLEVLEELEVKGSFAKKYSYSSLLLLYGANFSSAVCASSRDGRGSSISMKSPPYASRTARAFTTFSRRDNSVQYLVFNDNFGSLSYHVSCSSYPATVSLFIVFGRINRYG